ncbi:DNA (cytosine-5)-methyltransferase CMT3 [Linum grandiflorum]
MARKSTATKRKRQPLALPQPSEVDEMQAASSGEIEVISGSDDGANSSSTSSKRRRTTRAVPKPKAMVQCTKTRNKKVRDESDPHFLGTPFSADEARKRWPNRYIQKDKSPVKRSRVDTGEELVEARCHYSQAKVDGTEYKLNDNAHVQAPVGEDSYICKIVEMFEGVDRELYFTAQWYYRAKDTIIEDAHKIDKKRVFLSDVKNDNPLDCLVEKLNILMCPLEDWEAKKSPIAECHYYCNALYLLRFATFLKLPSELMDTSESSSTISQSCEVSDLNVKSKAFTLLDLYSGCGGMSTGLSLGSKLSGQELVTKWAVDTSEFALASLKLNHPETEVRNEKVDNFLVLLKEWEKLCIRFSLISSSDPEKKQSYPFDGEEDECDSSDDEDDVGADGTPDDSECFELEKVLDICYGEPEGKDCGLYFKIKWKGYGPEYDSWEPIIGLGTA